MKHYLYFVIITLLIYSCSNPEKDFNKAKQENSEEAYNEFIAKHPGSELINEAEKALRLCAFNNALKEKNIESISKFLKKYPSSEYAEKAQKEFLIILFSKSSFNDIDPKEIFMLHYNYFAKNGKYFEDLNISTNSMSESDLLPYKEISYLFSNESNNEVTVYFKSGMKKGELDMKLGNKVILKWENDQWVYQSSYYSIINKFEKDWKSNRNVKWNSKIEGDKIIKDFMLNNTFVAYYEGVSNVN